MAKQKSMTKLQYLIRLAVLIAILILLEVTGLGMIRTGGLELTILQIPVIIGAILLGVRAGGILGGVFGLISLWECFGKSAFGAMLLSISPLGTVVTCLVPRILMGILCALIFQLIYHFTKKILPFVVASLCGALLNTIFFMTSLIFFFYSTEYIQGFVYAMGTKSPFTFVLAFIGVQGLIEAVLATVVGAAISKALYLVLYRNK